MLALLPEIEIALEGREIIHPVTGKYCILNIHEGPETSASVQKGRKLYFCLTNCFSDTFSNVTRMYGTDIKIDEDVPT